MSTAPTAWSATHPAPFAASAASYRQAVLDRLPRASILSPEALAAYPLGSDVSTVPETCGVLSPHQTAITRMDATDLVNEMAAGKLSSEEVVLAFGLRAAVAHQLVCCLTDFWLEDALVRARELDAVFKSTGKTVGPLHGLPISLKDQLTVKGRVTSMSFLSVHQTATPAAASALLCDILEEAGAVFYCHTTLPQTIMHLECESFWGRTLNPFNTSLTPGGSSGGEGALVGMRGSPLGIGTDIGGSVRSPAGNCGLYGLRPTAQRVPNGGSKTYIPGRDSVLGVVGPLTHSLRDVELFMAVAVGPKAAPWITDPAYLEIPWRLSSVPSRRKLRVGVMWTDGEVRPTMPIRRALEGLVAQLRTSANIEVVDFKPYKAREAWEIVRRLYFPDGGRRIKDLTVNSASGEPLHPLTEWLLTSAGEKPVQEITDMHVLWDLNVERESYRTAFATHWNSQDVDVVLCPVAPYPAPPHDTAKWWSYTSLWNLVDYPCISFPTGAKVDQELDREPAADAYTPLNADDKLVHDNYTPKLYASAPVSLQLVARRYRDETVMDSLKLIQAIIALDQ